MRIPILLFFDDGVRGDLVVAELLAKRKLKAVLVFRSEVLVPSFIRKIF
jgi:hypothetical protein